MLVAGVEQLFTGGIRQPEISLRSECDDDSPAARLRAHKESKPVKVDVDSQNRSAIDLHGEDRGLRRRHRLDAFEVTGARIQPRHALPLANVLTAIAGKGSP